MGRNDRIGRVDPAQVLLRNTAMDPHDIFSVLRRHDFTFGGDVCQQFSVADMHFDIDILKGTWNELPTRKKWWKGLLLIGAFIVAIAYDIIIKMLNALMLSINTFTTLGFGEIPIKGLPRYLAIIQGFIGWFMLTIFSVSLISQLLN